MPLIQLFHYSLKADPIEGKEKQLSYSERELAPFINLETICSASNNIANQVTAGNISLPPVLMPVYSKHVL